MYLKRAMKGRINIMGAAMAVQKELMSIPEFGTDDSSFAAEFKAIANFKKAILMCAGAAAQKLMMQLEHEQEILMNIADMLIDTFQAECVLLRAVKMKNNNHAEADIALDIARTFITDAADRINHAGKIAVNSFAEGDDQRMMLLGIKRFTKTENFNTKAARRRIAERVIEAEKYLF
jgi:predicted phage tail protein